MNTFIPGTAESRYAISFNGDMHLAALDRIHRLYHALWEDQFAPARNRPIGEWDFELIGDLLCVLNDALFNEVRDMALEMGEDSVCGVEPYLRMAKEAERAIECNKLVDKARDRQRKAGTEESREAYQAKVDALAALPDEDAIPLLKALLGKGEA